MSVLQLVPVARRPPRRERRGSTARQRAPAAAAPAAVGTAAPPFARAAKDRRRRPSARRSTRASPSWKAYLGYYIVIGFAALIMIGDPDGGSNATASARSTKTLRRARSRSPLAVAFGFGVTFYRKSIKFRVTTTVIEVERGLLSKRIDVLQLWRVRDVVYKQNLVDRILGIAHVEVVRRRTRRTRTSRSSACRRRASCSSSSATRSRSSARRRTSSASCRSVTSPLGSMRAIVFDLDGTLVDSLPDIIGHLNAALVDAGYPVRSPDEVRAWVGHGAGVLVARAVGDGDAAAVLAGYQRHYRAAPYGRTHVFAGLDAALDALAGGRMLGCCRTSRTSWSSRSPRSCSGAGRSR